MTLHFTNYYGLHLQRGADASGKMWLYGVIWFRRGPKELGYWYPSIRWL